MRILAVIAALMLAACSSSPEINSTEPASLPDFDKEVSLDHVWSAQVGKGMGEGFARLNPASDGKTLYLADAEGELQARELASGHLIYRLNIDMQITGGLLLDGDSLYLSNGDGDMVALNAADGSVKWQKRLTSEVMALPAISGNDLLVQTVDGKLHLLDKTDGRNKWSYDSNMPLLSLRGTSSPVIYRDQAIAGFANGKVVGLNMANGQPLWEERIGIPAGRSELERLVDIDGRLLVDNDLLYVVGYQGSLEVIDLRTGRPQWKKDASSYAGPLYGLGNLYVLDADDQLHAFDDRGGNDVWQQNGLYRRQLTEPVFFNNLIAVADAEGYIHLIKQLDGAIVGRDRVKRPALDWVAADSYDFRHPTRYFDLDPGIRTRLNVVGDYLVAINNAGFVNIFQLDQ
ncbi:MAG: outer membrane protein assembly factor BamB [Oceanospirillaceae bacterium]|nr:outer membrane protein assembly factor BamB [Oceanospirillaceae bacterium]MCP5335469.1 outer membrane protein assembly factor BamB [Oceanospirillaceae bacterium]MCP5349864.1 outer membrane protein assembly factor BamB [Oceanospirillaceae bacterium]